MGEGDQALNRKRQAQADHAARGQVILSIAASIFSGDSYRSAAIRARSRRIAARFMPGCAGNRIEDSASSRRGCVGSG